MRTLLALLLLIPGCTKPAPSGGDEMQRKEIKSLWQAFSEGAWYCDGSTCVRVPTAAHNTRARIAYCHPVRETCYATLANCNANGGPCWGVE